jgi:Lysyl oxidase
VIRALYSRAAIAAAAFLVTPLAAWADTGPCGTNIGGALPDLIVNATKLAQYLSVSEEKYGPTSCAVQEGFVAGPGWHTVLRFAVSTPNVGPGALVIGNPQNCPALFEASRCHGHLHFKQYAAYRLWTASGYDTWVAMRDLGQPTNVGVNAATLSQAVKNKSLLVGRKMGFCMVDTDQYSATANPTPTYISCTISQGISPGWSDSYAANLDGQYVEIDNLKSGDYVLEIQANPELQLPEVSTLNNSTAIRIRYTARQGGTAASVLALPPS